jgi:DNA polymerase epsilon subunit 1
VKYTKLLTYKDIRCGYWYTVEFNEGRIDLIHRTDLLQRADPKILVNPLQFHLNFKAFDIETTKLPLQFPNPESDNVMMISYMLDGKGFLIVNRQIVGEDIQPFEYTPKSEYESHFTIFNVEDEVILDYFELILKLSTLKKFFSHMREVKPNVYVTFNGDYFDWPFIEARAKAHKLNLFEEIGVRSDNGEYKCKYGAHLDVFCWVRRDSYLPQGQQGLKVRL